MSRCPKALSACTTTTALVCGTAWTPAPANAANASKADTAAIEQAIVACKAEARGKKIKWLSRRKYVNHCVTEALKDHPNIEITTLLKNNPNLTNLPVEQWPGF
jgi:hypothetical protein